MREEERWAEMDRYIRDTLVRPDRVLDEAQQASREAGLPAISVSAPQGALLQAFVRMVHARRILEVGTLGGYSTIWMARGLPAEGRLISLEIDPKHAQVARSNLARAGLQGIVEVRVGAAVESLRAMVEAHEEAFDLVFIDADKPNNTAYFDRALELSHPGTAIVVDNVVRAGEVLDATSTDPAVQGVRRLNERMATVAGLQVTQIQTVGEKGHAGFALALVP